jgi:RNA polymerase sigma-70 factor (ECF subfamily)
VGNWESIVREHGPMAFETAWRVLGHAQDTEDAVQDALVDALQLYRRDTVRNWGGLLRQLATRRALDRLRRRRRELPVESEPASPIGEQPEQRAVARELAAELRRAVADLPDRQAGVFSLRYFAELTNPEIATVLGISVEAVGVALSRARTALSRKLNLCPIEMPRRQR